MKIERIWVYGMASAAIVALVITINTMCPVNKINVQGKSEAKANVEVLANKTNETVQSSDDEKVAAKPQAEVPVDFEVEKGDQKNADAGSSPWKLDPLFVSQVFVSLKISPQGIQGDYPVKYEDLKLVDSSTEEAVVEVSVNNTPVKKVYLKKLVRQDSTGIWTVVGYDPIEK